MKTITFDETKWKLVPVEPTREMLIAALDTDNASYDNHQYVLTEQWKDMLAAAPSQGHAVPEGAVGFGAQALAAELAEAALKDDQDPEGHDISAGLFGPNVSEWLRKVAREYLAAPAREGVPTMTTNTEQALREALRRIKSEAVSLADAQVLALEALALPTADHIPDAGGKGCRSFD